MEAPKSFEKVQQLMERAIARGCFPSACLLVTLRGQPLVHSAFGRSSRLDTLYDLASLTKVLATTAVTMQLVADRRLSLDAPVSRWVPEVKRAETRDLRLVHLLAHCSGLPAWLPLFRDPSVQAASPARRKGVIRRRVASTPLEAKVGRQTVYSDLGFILLEWVLERCGGQPLDELTRKRVLEPLGLSRMRFIRHNRRGLVQRLGRRFAFAPTERCPWRRRRLLAEVHDDNCHAMGGVAGHAGLFGTAHEVSLVAHEIAAACRGGRSIFDRETVRRFLRTRPRRQASRVLGWDTPSPGGSTGRHFGRRTVGHLGFTGTSLWIDLSRALIVVLLTNRVYNGREPNPMIAFRPRLHDAVVRAVDRIDGEP
jgi:CubicO group peptidase (beta-lactamase class C family)